MGEVEKREREMMWKEGESDKNKEEKKVYKITKTEIKDQRGKHKRERGIVGGIKERNRIETKKQGKYSK
jgi:hypothetical protein